MSALDPEDRVIVHNPESGDADHVDAVRDRAALLGYDVRETEEAGDAITLAREAAEAGASRIVASGGDGTVNEVLRGIDRADAFEDVTFGVVPAGTGNNFAGNIGVTSIEDAFQVLEGGTARRIDIGRANDRVFVNSCVAGLTADASAETSADLKSRYGVLAYVVTTIRTVTAFDGLQLTISTGEDDAEDPAWTGEAVCVFVGNGRPFPTEGRPQADMEDGLFDVTVVDEAPAVDLVEEAVVQRFTGSEAPHTVSMRSPSLEVSVLEPNEVNYSLDGEMIRAHTVSLDVEPRTLQVLVGDGYDPDPGE